MFRNFTLIVAALAVAGLVGGCAGKMTESRNFLSTYDNLKEVDPNFSGYIAPDMTLENYPKMIIDPLDFDLSAEDAAKFDDEQRQEIKEYTQKALEKLMTQYFQIVKQPGPKTVRFRMAFTDMEKSDALLALYPMTRITGVGRGGAAAQGEVVDSQTGTQLAAFTRVSKGSFAHGSGVGSLSDIETAIDTWAEAADKRLAKVLK
jgi:hypothetical protein